MFHRHAWKLIDKTEMSSAYDQMSEAGKTIDTLEGGGAVKMFRRVVIYVFQCEHCRAVKIEKVENP